MAFRNLQEKLEIPIPNELFKSTFISTLEYNRWQ